MDLTGVTRQLEVAKYLLEEKAGVLAEGTAAFQTILAIEELVRQLNNSFGSTRKVSHNEDNKYDFR